MKGSHLFRSGLAGSDTAPRVQRVGRTRVKERSTHARPGVHMQQCSAVLLFGPKPVDIESKSAISLPEGLLLALAEPCFVKGVQRIDGRFFIYRSGNPAFSFDDPLISTTALPFWRSTMKFQFMQSPENLCSPAIPRPQAHNTCSASSGRRWQDTCRRKAQSAPSFRDDPGTWPGDGIGAVSTRCAHGT